MRGPMLAVIGAGFSGTLLALHLLRRCPASARVALIERHSRFGRGQAYAEGNPSHLLNVPAGRMSAFHDRPLDFVTWLADLDAAERGEAGVEPGGFVPRRLFGAYVRDLLNEELKRRDPRDRLELVRGDAHAVERTAEGLVIRLDRDRSVRADIAVLAIGNFPPEPPPVADPWVYDSPFYRADPWAPGAVSDLFPFCPVLLIGTGLTMVDTVLSLLDQGHAGPIHAISRRGKLPLRHADGPSQAVALPPLPSRLAPLSREVTRLARAATRGGGDWRAVLDALRPSTVGLWQSLSDDDRARFLRHLRPWWDIHRHRMPTASADRIQDAIKAGQLRISAGRIQSYARDGDEVVVAYRPRGTDDRREVRAARVVNCSGPGTDFARIAHPLIGQLRREGMARRDPRGLGLEVTGTCALIDGEGRAAVDLFAVGPVTKGAFWEMTAVPDIRRQCEELACRIAAGLS